MCPIKNKNRYRKLCAIKQPVAAYRKNGNKIILDAYNANPSSMSLAIENFAGLTGNKVLIIGSMMELGHAADEEHDKIIELIKNIHGRP